MRSSIVKIQLLG